MRIENRRIEMADGSVKHLTTVFDEADPEKLDPRRLWFLRTLADNAATLRCGGLPYDTMLIKHDGNCWLAEMTAVEGRKR